MSSDATWSNATLADDVQVPDDQNVSLVNPDNNQQDRQKNSGTFECY